MSTIATEVTGSGFDFGSIKEMMDAFDPAALLPDLGGFGDLVARIAGFAVLAGPVVLLVMGLAYLFLAPKEANYRFGYRCYHGMGSVQAWRFTQRLAGIIWSGLGLILTVVMWFISAGFAGSGALEIVDAAVTCLIWEILLAIISCLVINGLVMLFFNSKGALRKR